MTHNSALHWLPPLVAAGLPVPRTRVVPFEAEDLFPILDGGDARPGFQIESVVAAAAEIGAPCFLRTDLTSAKHSGPSAYKIADLGSSSVGRAIYATFEDSVSKLLECMPRAFLVREWLDLPAPFTAFDGHPIAREHRILVEFGRVRGFFYWPRAAFENQLDERPEDFEALYATLSAPLSPAEAASMEEMAREAVQAIGHGDWSVDFARDASGKLWLIDMALAEASWKPPSLT